MQVVKELQDPLNIVSFGRAVYIATLKALEHYKNGSNALINPSRGANPIVQGMIGTLHYIAGYGNEDAINLLQHLYRPDNVLHETPFMIVPYPMTADVRIDTETLRSHDITMESVIDTIRNYGANVITKLALASTERRKDHYFRLLSWLFSRIEHRRNTKQFYESIPPIENPIFIDTAISGRASSTILQAFDGLGFNVRPIVFADQNGGRLRKPYERYFNEKMTSGDLTLLPIRRIMSEDQGASLLGYYAIFYPQLMLAALELRKGDIPMFETASAVTWHDVDEDVTKDKFVVPYRDAFHSFTDLITKSSCAVVDLDKRLGGGIDALSDEEIMSYLDVKDLSTAIKNTAGVFTQHGMPRTEDQSTLKMSFGEDRIEQADETRSHVVHILFKPDYLAKSIDDMRRYLLSGI